MHHSGVSIKGQFKGLDVSTSIIGFKQPLWTINYNLYASRVSLEGQGVVLPKNIKLIKNYPEEITNRKALGGRGSQYSITYAREAVENSVLDKSKHSLYYK